MSNNACRLLFRVGETHWIIQGQDSLSFIKAAWWFRCFVRVLSPCWSPLTFLSWPWLSLQRQHGWHRRWQRLVFIPYLQASSKQREWVGRTTGSWLLLVQVPPVSVYSTPCATLGWAGASVLKKADYSFTMSYSAFHPRYVSVLVHLQCQLLLSGFLKM